MNSANINNLTIADLARLKETTVKTYTIDIETFDGPATRLPSGQWNFKNHKKETRTITGYRAAVATAKAEAAKNPCRCVILRDASGKGRKF